MCDSTETAWMTADLFEQAGTSVSRFMRQYVHKEGLRYVQQMQARIEAIQVVMQATSPPAPLYQTRNVARNLAERSRRHFFK